MKSKRPSVAGNRPSTRPSTGATRGATATRRPERPPAPEPTHRQQGAVQSKVRIADKFDAYFAHHSTSAIDSLARLFETPFQSLMTWLVIAIAVAIPAALYIGFANLQQLGESWEGSSQVSVFLKPETTDARAEEMRAKLATRADIAKVVYVSPAQGLAEFKAQSGLGEVVDSLEKNPLPGTLLVTPRLADGSDAAVTSLEQSLLADPAVADVRLDMQWVKRLQQLMVLGKKMVYGLGGLLALGVLLVIGNTIRLAIENRRDEILVIKLVGGTDAYVARPFLYTGLWYGIGGGLLALLILGAGFLWVSATVDQLAALYQSNFRLQGLGVFGSMQLVLLAGLTGLLGAWIAVVRHLIQIQPR
ncbi:permease-like cell division protein FtsX [Cellvibrio sp.]|uniref:permease-like cell division protein FtsX n=1 Tax=Cellvibrio sp. TaxID=1965322 RepID=UPI003964772A